MRSASLTSWLSIRFPIQDRLCESRSLRVAAICGAAMSAFGADPASALDIALGEQDFADGALIADGATFDAASAGEPAPFDGFRGFDLGVGGPPPPFDASFTFSFAPADVTAATLTLGLFDHDSAAPGSQIDFFELDGIDLTADLDALFESMPGLQLQVRVYDLALPQAALAALADGVGVFSLRLAAPGLQGVAGSDAGDPLGDVSEGNGAGLDFAALAIETSGSTVPEPGTATLALGGLALLAAARRRRLVRGRPPSAGASQPLPTAGGIC